jgi:hypothetical protein
MKDRLTVNDKTDYVVFVAVLEKRALPNVIIDKGT